MEARDLPVEILEAARYPIREVSVEERGPDESETVAEPVPNAIDTDEIEAAIRWIEVSGLVGQASWSSTTSD